MDIPSYLSLTARERYHKIAPSPERVDVLYSCVTCLILPIPWARSPDIELSYQYTLLIPALIIAHALSPWLVQLVKFWKDYLTFPDYYLKMSGIWQIFSSWKYLYCYTSCLSCSNWSSCGIYLGNLNSKGRNLNRVLCAWDCERWELGSVGCFFARYPF